MKTEKPLTKEEKKQYTELQMRIMQRHQKALDLTCTNFVGAIKGKTRRQIKVIFRRYTQDWKVYVANENTQWPTIPLKPSAFEDIAKNYIMILPEPSLFNKIVKKIFGL